MSYIEIYKKLFQQITETLVGDNTYVNELFSKSHGNITYLIFKNLHNNLLYYKADNADNAKFYEICSYILCFIYSYTDSINKYEIYDRNNSKIQNAIKKLFNDFTKINNNTLENTNIPTNDVILIIDEVKKESLHHMYMDMIERIESTHTSDIDNRINSIVKDIDVEFIKLFRIQIKNQIHKLFRIMKTEYGILGSDFNKLQNLESELEQSVERNVNEIYDIGYAQLYGTITIQSEFQEFFNKLLNTDQRIELFDDKTLHYYDIMFNIFKPSSVFSNLKDILNDDKQKRYEFHAMTFDIKLLDTTLDGKVTDKTGIIIDILDIVDDVSVQEFNNKIQELDDNQDFVKYLYNKYLYMYIYNLHNNLLTKIGKKENNNGQVNSNEKYTELLKKLPTNKKLNNTLSLESESESESELDNYLNNFVKKIFVSNTENNDLQIREIMQGLDYTNNNTHNLLFNKLNGKLIENTVGYTTTNTTNTTPYILYLLHILSMYKFYESNECKMNFVLLTEEIDPMSN
jgi:hypothetical protein